MEFRRPVGVTTPLMVVDAGVTVYLDRCHLLLNGQPLEQYVQCGTHGAPRCPNLFQGRTPLCWVLFPFSMAIVPQNLSQK